MSSRREKTAQLANAEAEVLNALASALTKDSSVTAENSDCPVENSGSSINNGSAAISSTETTNKDCKPALAMPKKGEVLQGTLAVLCPDGTQTNIRTLFDFRSGTDAISRKAAMMLKQSGIARGDAGENPSPKVGTRYLGGGGGGGGGGAPPPLFPCL